MAAIKNNGDASEPVFSAARDKGDRSPVRKREHRFESRLLRVSEVADYLRVHPSTVYRMLKNRQIPAYRIGNDWRFDRDKIEEWIDQREVVQHAKRNDE